MTPADLDAIQAPAWLVAAIDSIGRLRSEADDSAKVRAARFLRSIERDELPPPEVEVGPRASVRMRWADGPRSLTVWAPFRGPVEYHLAGPGGVTVHVARVPDDARAAIGWILGWKGAPL